MNYSIKGYVYIFSNPSFEFVKIGYSDRDPLIRLEELNTTGVPTPFIFEFTALVYEPKNVEKLIHGELSNYRVNPDREFFRLTANNAVVKTKEILRSNNISVMYEESRHNVIDSKVNQNLISLEKSIDPTAAWPFPLSMSKKDDVSDEDIFDLLDSIDEDEEPEFEKVSEFKKSLKDDLTKLLTPSEELALIVGNSPLTMTQAVSKLWVYIKENGFKHDRIIHTDANMRAVFGKSKLTIFELGGLMRQHLKD